MKVFAIVMLGLIAVASANSILSDEQKEKIRGYAIECREKEGVTKEELQALRGGDFSGSESVKKVVNCVFEKVGFIADGVVKADVLNSKLSQFVAEDKLKAVAEKCNGVSGTHAWDTAFALLECYYNNKAALL